MVSVSTVRNVCVSDRPTLSWCWGGRRATPPRAAAAAADGTLEEWSCGRSQQVRERISTQQQQRQHGLRVGELLEDTSIRDIGRGRSPLFVYIIIV